MFQLSICTVTKENHGKPGRLQDLADAYTLLDRSLAFKCANCIGSRCLCSCFVLKHTHVLLRSYCSVLVTRYLEGISAMRQDGVGVRLARAHYSATTNVLAADVFGIGIFQ
jgi:hypothetical protein